MGPKRKRASTKGGASAHTHKRLKSETEVSPLSTTSTDHPTLALYYGQILTLRKFLLSKLPKSSKTRRRKLIDAGVHPKGKSTDKQLRLTDGADNCLPDENIHLANVLDKTLVCVNEVRCNEPLRPWMESFEYFSQRTSPSAGSSIGKGISSQCDLVDFAIWLLFHKVHRSSHKPPHMLCHGYQRATSPHYPSENHCAVAGIPGVVSRYPNENVSTMKNAAWTDILGILGKEGDEIMLSVIVDCSLFAAIDGGRQNHYQLSGKTSSSVQERKELTQRQASP